ncbi:MAG: hypothetical protein ACHQZS_02045 [Candidatus Binatales bacterium]
MKAQVLRIALYDRRALPVGVTLYLELSRKEHERLRRLAHAKEQPMSAVITQAIERLIRRGGSRPGRKKEIAGRDAGATRNAGATRKRKALPSAERTPRRKK